MRVRLPYATPSLLLAAVTTLTAGVATAQTTTPRSQGPMTVERVDSGFLVAPEVKVTRFDRRTSELIGAYGGWLGDQLLFIGGGGYWLANPNRDRSLGYGGLVIGLMPRTDRTVSFGVKGLIGGGRSTTLESVTLFDDRDVRILTPSTGGRGPGSIVIPVPVTTNVRVRDEFFVAEPEANVIVNLGNRFHLSAGVGYRFTGRDHSARRDVDGVTGTVALQIGH
jgi:hypothetical protein